MFSLEGQTCESFIDALASCSATPGGGGASALVAAVGIALGNMAGSLTIGKKKYADVEAEIIRLNNRAQALEKRLLALVDEDALAFAPLGAAYALPRDTPAERAQRIEFVESCLDQCCAVPLEIMEVCCEGIDLCAAYAKKGSRGLLSDAGCGVLCLKGALQAASLNVFVNTKAMSDAAYAAQLNERADSMVEAYSKKADEVYAFVLSKLRKV